MTYWTSYGSGLSESAKRVAHLHRALEVPIKNADHFFVDLEEKVSAIRDFDRSHPLSKAVGVATLERYLEDDRNPIRASKLVEAEVDRVIAQLSLTTFPIHSAGTKDDFVERVRRYESITETLRSMISTVARWARDDGASLIRSVIQRLLATADETHGLNELVRLARYPALLVWYAAGLRLVADEKYDTLRALFETPLVVDREEGTLVQFLHLWGTASPDNWQSLWTPNRRYTPLSDHLRDVLDDLIPQTSGVAVGKDQLFDRFEYFVALANVVAKTAPGEVDNIAPPYGRFIWRGRRTTSGYIWESVDAEARKAENDWPPLKAGLFGGTYSRFNEISSAAVAFFKSQRTQML